MKLYYKKDHPVTKFHKNLIRKWQDKTGMTDYQTLWLSFVKGIIIGAILL